MLITISFVKSAWSALFEISEAFDTLFTFIHLIICFISSFKMNKLNDVINDMNESEMSLTSA